MNPTLGVPKQREFIAGTTWIQVAGWKDLHNEPDHVKIYVGSRAYH